jgi:hypothetical protein
MSPTEDRGRCSRRRLLRTGGATLATGVTATLAGCPSGIPPLSGQLDFGRIDAPQPAAGEYAKWIPAASEFEDGEDAPLGHAWHARPSRLSASAFGPASLPVGITTGQLDYFGVGYRNYDHAIAILSPYVTVALADFDRATVADAVADTGYEARADYRGYAVYGRSDLPRAVGVADGALVYAQSGLDDPDEARARVETAIDAGEGRIPRQVETEPAFGALLDRAGGRPANWLGSAPFGAAGETPRPALDSLVTSSISWDYDDDAVYYVYDLVFPEDEQAPAGAIKRALRSQQRAVDSALIDVETDGRFARVEMRLTPGMVRDTATGDGHPQITWGVDYDRANRRLTVRHEAGETADAAQLSVDGDAAGASPFEESDTFGPGDSVTLGVDDPGGGPVRIVYEEPDSHSSMTVFAYDVSEVAES